MAEPGTMSDHDRPVDATAELAYYAEKYRYVTIDEQFDLLLVYSKSLAAETQNTSLTNGEIAWLTRSVRNALAAARPAGDRVMISVEAKAILDRILYKHGDTYAFLEPLRDALATPAPGGPVGAGEG